MNEVMQLSLYQIIALVLTVGGALIGLYVRFNNQIILIEARVKNLEKEHNDLEEKIEKIWKGVNKILIILAENQIHSKSN